jgi:GNAT superfamily N-acetyltransferase
VNVHFRAATECDLPVFREIDDDAGILFESAGLFLDLPDDNDFVRGEQAHWQRSLADGRSLVAMDHAGDVAGFIAVRRLDADPYVAQLSVRRSHMRRGIGAALLRQVIRTCAADGSARLRLTTYAHLPWNRPFYERHAFALDDEAELGPELRAQLDLERRWLPLPRQRVAMSRVLVTTAASGDRPQRTAP